MTTEKDESNPTVWRERKYDDVFGFEYDLKVLDDGGLSKFLLGTMLQFKIWTKEIFSWSSLMNITFIMALGLIITGMVLWVKGSVGWANVLVIVISGVLSALVSARAFLDREALAVVRCEFQLQRYDETILTSEMIGALLEDALYQAYSPEEVDEKAKEVADFLKTMTPIVSDKVTHIKARAKARKTEALQKALKIINQMESGADFD